MALPYWLGTDTQYTILLGNVMSIPVVLAVTNVSIDAQPALWYDTLPPRLL